MRRGAGKGSVLYNRSCDRIRNFRTQTEPPPPRAARPHERPLAELGYHIYHSPGRESRHLDGLPVIFMTLTVVGVTSTPVNVGRPCAPTRDSSIKSAPRGHSHGGAECPQGEDVVVQQAAGAHGRPKSADDDEARFLSDPSTSLSQLPL